MADDEQGKPAAIGTVARVGDRLVVHLPPSIKMPLGEVTVRRDGDRLIIERPRKTLVDLLGGMEPLTGEDGFPNVDEGLLPLRDVDI